MLDKCGGSNAAEFYRWCARAEFNVTMTPFETICQNTFNKNRTCSTLFSILEPRGFDSRKLFILETCENFKKDHLALLTINRFRYVKSRCEYIDAGRPLSLWIWIAIILAILLAIGGLSALALKYFPRGGRNPKEGSARTRNIPLTH